MFIRSLLLPGTLVACLLLSAPAAQAWPSWGGLVDRAKDVTSGKDDASTDITKEKKDKDKADKKKDGKDSKDEKDKEKDKDGEKDKGKKKQDKLSDNSGGYEQPTWKGLIVIAKNTMEEAKEPLGKATKEVSKKVKKAAKEAAELIMDNEMIRKAKAEWDALAISERIKNAFGEDVDEKSALTGHFFDLKRPLPDAKTDKGAPVTPARPQDTVQIIAEFNDKDWDPKVLARYYSPKVKLLAPFFYLPRCRAQYAPEAFQCDEAEDGKAVQPCCWVVLYQGMVTAPKSGKFRFVGMCDDAMLVRFNKELVLEHGWSIPTRRHMTLGTNPQYRQETIQRKDSPAAYYQYRQTPHWNHHIGGVASGLVFEVEEGESYPIEILLSEIPGEEFGFVLLVEEIEDEKTARKGYILPTEAPKLHLFRTNASFPEEGRIREALGDRLVGNMECPPYLEDSKLIWKVDSETKYNGFFERLFGNLTGKRGKTAMGVSEAEEEGGDVIPGANPGSGPDIIVVDNKHKKHKKHKHQKDDKSDEEDDDDKE